MQRLISIAALTLLLAGGHVYAREDVDGPITHGLWEALGTAWPDRLTARARWVADPDALFETPLVRESDRIGVQQLISCTRSVRWACARPDEELHIQANGIRHRTRAQDVDRAVVLKIVDYLYSSCFHAQQKQLGRKASMPRGNYRASIYDIADMGNGTFHVATGTDYQGTIFRIEAEPGDETVAHSS